MHQKVLNDMLKKFEFKFVRNVEMTIIQNIKIQKYDTGLLDVISAE